MRLRLTKVDEFQFLTCITHKVWGSEKARFKEWHDGDYLVFTVDKSVAGFAEVTGQPYISQERVWDNGVFKHRIPIKFIHVMFPENRPPILGEIRDALTSAFGTRYGLGILYQWVLQDSPAKTIIRNIRAQRNDLTEVENDLQRYLENANLKRETVVKIKRKSSRPSKQPKLLLIEPNEPGTEAEESAHSATQFALIQLVKTTSSNVWIATNDRNRLYKGKILGDGCLKAFPNLGLSEDATRSISLIDVIWIRQNAPVCAFEVETTTSVYSGLLRMSDLLSVVPALNIKLFIVAPRERQGKVMSELSRPTFQKIGLSDFCRFIPAEDLQTLLAKVKDLPGYVQSNIVETIAVSVEEDINSTLE